MFGNNVSMSISLITARLLLSKQDQEKLSEEFLRGNTNVVHLFQWGPSKGFYWVRTQDPVIFSWRNNSIHWDEIIYMYENIDGMVVATKYPNMRKDYLEMYNVLFNGPVQYQDGNIAEEEFHKAMYSNYKMIETQAREEHFYQDMDRIEHLGDIDTFFDKPLFNMKLPSFVMPYEEDDDTKRRKMWESYTQFHTSKYNQNINNVQTSFGTSSLRGLSTIHDYYKPAPDAQKQGYDTSLNNFKNLELFSGEEKVQDPTDEMFFTPPSKKRIIEDHNGSPLPILEPIVESVYQSPVEITGQHIFENLQSPHVNKIPYPKAVKKIHLPKM